MERRVFTAAQIAQLPTHGVCKHPVLADYLAQTPARPGIAPELILAASVEALGPAVLGVFLTDNAEATLSTAGMIIEDHLRKEDLTPKDLQVNLVVNILVKCVRARNLPKEQRYVYGENLVRKCNFDNQFKLAIKKSLFDADAVNLPWLVIAHYNPKEPENPGIWMQ